MDSTYTPSKIHIESFRQLYVTGGRFVLYRTRVTNLRFVRKWKNPGCGVIAPNRDGFCAQPQNHVVIIDYGN